VPAQIDQTSRASFATGARDRRRGYRLPQFGPAGAFVRHPPQL